MCLKSKEVTTIEKEKERSSSEMSTSSSRGRNPTRMKEEPKDVTFIVLQKNTRSMNSRVRIDKMFSEVQGCKWDAIFGLRDMEIK